MPGIGYQKQDIAVHQSRLNRLRRRSCYITLVLIGIFILAVFVGLMIGFRDKLDDNNDPKKPQQQSKVPNPADNSLNDDFPLWQTNWDDIEIIEGEEGSYK